MRAFGNGVRLARSRLLVSVRNCVEFGEAQIGGADWIDFKEPALGALGAVEQTEARRMVEANETLLPISAALGELVDWPRHSYHPLLAVPGIRVVKLGLANSARQDNWQAKWLEVQRAASEQNKKLAAVVYADWETCHAPPPEEVLSLAKARSVPFVLIDTFDKGIPGVLELQALAALVKILQLARSWDCQVALAGGLGESDFPRLRTLDFDILAVRGAACEGGRESQVRARLVERLQAAWTGGG